jgi:hypothetical protein
MPQAWAGVESLKVQYGRESAAGTAVPATGVWRGPFAMLKDDRTFKVAEENVGSLIPTERRNLMTKGASLALPEAALTFEQLPHILEAGIKTATPTGAGPYVYVYDWAAGVLNTVKTYTLEAGSIIATGDVREMEFAFVTDFELKAEADDYWMMSSNWKGKQLSASTFTAALSLLAVQQAILPKTKLYIDAIGGTIGTTQKSGVLMGATVSVETGLAPVIVGDNNQVMVGIKVVKKPVINFSLALELEQDATSHVAQQRAIYEAGTAQIFRLELLGDDANHKLWIDFVGKYDNVGDYESRDGNIVVTLEGHAAFDATAALFAKFTVTNQLATL